MNPTTTTDDATSSAAPTAAPAAAGSAPSSPAEEGRQRYIIRMYRLERMAEDPILVQEFESAAIEDLYLTSEGDRLIIHQAAEPNVLNVIACPSPAHAMAVLAVLHAVEFDQRLAGEEQPE